MITNLKENQIFIFGSNLNGNHFAGAAKQAHEQFGAEWGVGEGMTGQCYAFPTLDENMEKITKEKLEISRDKLYMVAKDNPGKVFLLTAVGTGIAGYDIEEMKELFKDVPDNIVKPKEFI